ncbi:antitermination protein NusB [uncultured Microbulbifer sp.]|uniref:antitermination protein NusB n=1 Tax=uncultured Microbulbifer sp. TaxID=348147 RepID=UPI0025DA0CD7|nr:antitermination protein NusB [uncultured Microbulbifer sp.]
MEEYQVMIQSREWLVGWGTLSLINAGLAQGKNRSGLLWWVLSLIFGPLATLVIVLLSKVPEKPYG